MYTGGLAIDGAPMSWRFERSGPWKVVVSIPMQSTSTPPNGEQVGWRYKGDKSMAFTSSGGRAATVGSTTRPSEESARVAFVPESSTRILAEAFVCRKCTQPACTPFI